MTLSSEGLGEVFSILDNYNNGLQILGRWGKKEYFTQITADKERRSSQKNISVNLREIVANPLTNIVSDCKSLRREVIPTPSDFV